MTAKLSVPIAGGGPGGSEAPLGLAAHAGGHVELTQLDPAGKVEARDLRQVEPELAEPAVA